MTQTTSSLSEGSRTRALGAHGEDLAVSYLSARGFTLVARNWRSGRQGELDLIMREGDALVAVEVKTRGGRGYGTPLESITPVKVARLRKLLLTWVHQHQPGARELRIDAIGITALPGSSPHIEHLRGIS
jgi:putative endonuclease